MVGIIPIATGPALGGGTGVVGIESGEVPAFSEPAAFSFTNQEAPTDQFIT